ncbi:hypothetical protein [Jannaschia rubra]|uniref:Uncharacterized protein n=1 Tax=Jannaschia rubra TaxID=282197 RepID=A0A0M6XL82_9RHOB|nr:hypothetical protein [Jannaschia rubra]CTQ31859.1 hypothetical protein JAN5088_00618 [Jannaschia rubra]SFG52082.1 hypothetical protein SAMN04488517_1065 [Jannaschia rubra]
MRFPLEAVGGYSGLDELIALAVIVPALLAAAVVTLIVFAGRGVSARLQGRTRASDSAPAHRGHD